MTKGLFIIDFDLTITQQHIHNLLSQAIYLGYIAEDDIEAQWNYVQNVPATGSELRWKNLFEKLIKNGHDVAIASFSAHKPIIERYLEKRIGLAENIYQKIFVESWLPTYPHHANKNKHIQHVIEHFNFQNSPENIVLVDDSSTNLVAARKLGLRIVDVIPGDETGQHLETISLLSEEIAKNVV